MVTAAGRTPLIGVTVGAVGASVAVAMGLLVVRSPLLVAAAGIAVFGLTLVVLRLDLAVLLYVAAEPIGGLLPTFGGLSTVRLIGAALFAAWLVRWVVDARPLALHPRVTAAAGALLLVILASLTVNAEATANLEVTTRYLSYLAVLIVLVDSLRHRVTPWLVARVFLWSCTLAAALGLAEFVREGGRAAGPQPDANDLAFFLVAAVPFAVAAMRGSRRTRLLHGAAVLVLLVGTAATFSRGAALGLLVGVCVALAVRLIRFRSLVIGSAVVAVGLSAVWFSVPSVVDRSVAEKQTVAQANIDSRFTSWRIAAEVTADYPLLGAGPGGYRTHYATYEARSSTDSTHFEVAHQLLLDVSSELGLLGLAAFLAVLGSGITAAWRARYSPLWRPEHDQQRLLGAAILTAFTTTLVAAVFLSEQYYLPLWLLVALGAAIDPRWMDRRTPCASSN